ncbi:hypothetical protein C4D60_Mb08t10710 [Musa balbisiana]|uniref:Glutathione peroxidase n=1 Tax=Musa balbisiana TaxID=52838 RepID=A0A4S8K2U1_MUSBA|nr:hypothetical protein C4D60_Mb08t10710 [Musa balbisiana]
MLCSPLSVFFRLVTRRSTGISVSLRLAKPLSSFSTKPLIATAAIPSFGPRDLRYASEMASTECAASIREFTVKVGLTDLLLCLEGPFDVGSPKDRILVHDWLFTLVGSSKEEILDAKGNGVDLSTYKGKVLQIVNVASQCELTNSNYMELSQLYEKYKGNASKELDKLAQEITPSFNDRAANCLEGQEPGSNEEIVEFACTHFKAEYPIFDEVNVNGDNAAPIYKFLRSNRGGNLGDSIKWNFAKFLINKDSHVVMLRIKL